ncbi:MAG: hypothetical protein Q4C70_09970 [Planctomycetia bacterium]|nr:hypothetical protein [Planctomycetia bacterium]
MSHFYSMDELKEEPVFVPIHDDGQPLEEVSAFPAEVWRARYIFMREEYVKYRWFYSPICDQVQKMEELLRQLCIRCLEAEAHSEKDSEFPLVRDMDLILGLISPEEYARQVAEEQAENLNHTTQDSHINHALDEICDEIERSAQEEG